MLLSPSAAASIRKTARHLLSDGLTTHWEGSVGALTRLRVRSPSRAVDWTTAYPDQLVDVLNGLMVILANPGDPQKVAGLGLLVGAFDAEGQPVGELRREIPGRWTVALTRAGDLLDRYSRIATAVWAIFSLVVVTVLVLTGNLDLTKFQLQK